MGGTKLDTPNDLILMSDAEKLTGKSRTWIRARVRVYDMEGRDKVSEQAVRDALREWQTPKLKKDSED